MSDQTNSSLLDCDKITAYLAKNLIGFDGPLQAQKFEIGQSNPTFLLSTPNQKYVLRRKPLGVLLKSAHAVDREYRVQSALQNSDVPVAKMHLYCDDESIIGSPFYVMDFVDGRSFDDPCLPELTPKSRRKIMDEMCRVLAAIHDIDLDQTGLADFGPTGNYYARQIDRWSKQYKASQTQVLPQMDALIDWMAANIPPDDGKRSLVHGDYRLDNMLFENDGTKCTAILDWELSTIGHPYADLAAVIMQWQMPATKEGRGLEGVDRADLGLPTDQEFIDAYCARRNIDGIDNFGFYLAFCFFRMAAILQGVLKRAVDGNASNPARALELTSLIPRFAAGGLNAAKNCK